MPEFDRLWDYDHPDKTEAAFRALLPAAGKESVSYRAELLSQIARTQGLQGKFDDARKTLDQAEALLTPDMAVACIRCLLERGRTDNSSETGDRGKAAFLQAWELAATAGEDFFAVDAAHMLGIIEPAERGMEWNLKAMAVAEKSASPRAKGWLGSLYNNMGWNYHDQGEFAKALELFQKDVAFRKERNATGPWRIARWSVARTLRSLGRVEEALAQQQALAVEHAAAKTGDGFVDEELGECLLALGKKDEAKPHFAQAYERLAQDSWFASHEAKRLARLKELGGK